MLAKFVRWKCVLQRSTRKSQQIDHKHLPFAHFIIADIASELKICTFAEIVPRTFYQLYGTQTVQGLVDYAQKFTYYASLVAPDPSLTL